MAKPRAKDCPLVGMMNVFGDYWTWLIVREAFYGASRFSEFAHYTGMARNLLSDRLSMLVAEGIFEKRDIGRSGRRYAYKLTEKGRTLQTVVVAMFQWSNKHLYGEGREPITLIERETGAPLPPVALRAEDGRELTYRDLVAAPGPGASEATKRRLATISAAAE